MRWVHFHYWNLSALDSLSPALLKYSNFILDSVSLNTVCCQTSKCQFKTMMANSFQSCVNKYNKMPIQHCPFFAPMEVCQQKCTITWYFNLPPSSVLSHKLQWVDSGSVLGFELPYFKILTEIKCSCRWIVKLWSCDVGSSGFLTLTDLQWQSKSLGAMVIMPNW
jgi:hypothetical protein